MARTGKATREARVPATEAAIDTPPDGSAQPVTGVPATEGTDTVGDPTHPSQTDHRQPAPPATRSPTSASGPAPSPSPAPPAPTWHAGTKWLVVSLCDGVGGAFACLAKLQLPHDAILAESDGDLRDFMHQKFPAFEMYAQCSNVTEDIVMKKFRKGNFTGIFLIGGPPCQPFSRAGRKAGFDDHRAAPLQHLCHLAQCLTSRAAQEHFKFVSLMEQVATMQAQHRERITEMFGDVPVLVQAADFGWVQRARFYWGAAATLQEIRGHASAEWEYLPPGKALNGAGVLRWAGGKCPECWAPRDGWCWQGRETESSGSVPLPGQTWRAVYQGGRFATFTTVFPHDADHGAAQADAAQKNRFFNDGRRFPLNTYSADNCVTKDMELRVLDADERERAMDYPPGWTSRLRMQGRSVEDSRCHAIGNGFHISSMALLIALLFSLPGTFGHRPCQQPTWAAQHIPGSIFDPRPPELGAALHIRSGDDGRRSQHAPAELLPEQKGCQGTGQLGHSRLAPIGALAGMGCS